MKYKTGDIVEGIITGIQPYGAFVSITKSITGLIHISEFSDGFVRDIDRIVKVGEKLSLQVISVDSELQQLCLSFKALHHIDLDEVNKEMIYTLPTMPLGFKSLAEALPQWLEIKRRELSND